jgi:hypothetical protein
MYDVGDTINSYRGEPTVNLLYSPGATNLINGAGDIYGRCTKTDLGNGKYKFVNNGTGFSTVRVYTNQSDLINGATYGCSVYFEDLIGSISIDWCDTGITGINSSTSPSGRLGGYGTRATYDGPYYFLDINFDSGGSVTLFNPQVEYKSHITPFVAGTRSATQGLLPIVGNSTIDLSNVSFDSNAQIVFDGTDDFIDTNFPSITLNTPTIEAVVYRSTNTGRYEAIIQNNVVSDDALYVYPNGTLGFWPCAASSLTVPTGQWSYVAVSYDGTNLIYNVNGVTQTITATCADITDWDFLRIGGFGAGDGERWIGKIAVSKVYDRALTANEFNQNYNKYKTRFNLP